MSTEEVLLPSGSNDRWKAPFDTEQINKLLWWQRNMHAYTCPNRGDGEHRELWGQTGALVPLSKGMWCLDCDYTQEWVHFVTL